MFLFPWCFSCCEIPWYFWLLSAYFPGFLREEPLVFLRFSLVFSKRPRKKRTGLCSHNFSEKKFVWGFIGKEFPNGMADCFPEGWGQGLEPGSTGPALAADDSSNANFNDSTCPIHEHSASPGEQGTGKGQNSQKARQGHFFFPWGKEKHEPQTCRRQGRTNHRRGEMPTMSQRVQLDHPEWSADLADANFPRGLSPKHQASVKLGGGGSSSGASSGTSSPSIVKGETGQAETPKEEKGTQQKKTESIEKLLATMAADDPLREDLEAQLEQLRTALKYAKSKPRSFGAKSNSARRKHL